MYLRTIIKGTHNSATGGELLWFLKPFVWLINPTSKCQDKTIQEQLDDGIKIFNLQIAYINNKWRFSHGLALYKENFFETISIIKSHATEENPIYIQLYLDKSYWCKQDISKFNLLINHLVKYYCDNKFIIYDTWVEGSNYHPYKKHIDIKILEHYWTKSWATDKSWLDKLPLPKRHSKKYNKEYKNIKCDYLMLDFYNI